MLWPYALATQKISKENIVENNEANTSRIELLYFSEDLYGHLAEG